MKIWERPETYLQDFYARAGNEWHHSAWDFRNPISSSSDKVHLDVQFSRTALADQYWVGIALYGSLA